MHFYVRRFSFLIILLLSAFSHSFVCAQDSLTSIPSRTIYATNKQIFEANKLFTLFNARLWDIQQNDSFENYSEAEQEFTNALLEIINTIRFYYDHEQDEKMLQASSYIHSDTVEISEFRRDLIALHRYILKICEETHLIEFLKTLCYDKKGKQKLNDFKKLTDITASDSIETLMEKIKNVLSFIVDFYFEIKWYKQNGQLKSVSYDENKLDWKTRYLGHDYVHHTYPKIVKVVSLVCLLLVGVVTTSYCWKFASGIFFSELKRLCMTLLSLVCISTGSAVAAEVENPKQNEKVSDIFMGLGMVSGFFVGSKAIFLDSTLELVQEYHTKKCDFFARKKDAEAKYKDYKKRKKGTRKLFHNHVMRKDKRNSHVNLSKIIGYEEQKQLLLPVDQAALRPAKFLTKGMKLPQTVLFYGPSGTGKTFFARALIGELGVPCLTINAADLLKEDGIAVGEKIFHNARKNSPCVIFIDEIDRLIGGKRTDNGDPHFYKVQDALIRWLEEESQNPWSPIITIATTNRVEALDDIFRRFVVKVRVELPNEIVRRNLIEKTLQSIIDATKGRANMKMFECDPAVDCDALAKKLEGKSHDTVVRVVHVACSRAVAQNRLVVIQDDFDKACISVIGTIPPA